MEKTLQDILEVVRTKREQLITILSTVDTAVVILSSQAYKDEDKEKVLEMLNSTLEAIINEANAIKSELSTWKEQRDDTDRTVDGASGV
jgi:PHD/YefM family antitoxin component YafN of YafNO toxin-antitoxin module